MKEEGLVMSRMAFDNPMMNGKLEHEVDDLQPRRLSTASRRCSRDQSTQIMGRDYYTDDTNHFETTHEALPRMEYYRNILTFNKHITRPTLDELHYPQPKEVSFGRFTDEREDDKPQKSGAIKFGWIRGVYMRCLLNIWGVLLFLRMGWMVGQAGIGLSLIIVALATVVTILTTMSMSAICTNGEIGGGGVYYLVSRCLGPEIGGAVGLIFSFATSVAVAMYIVGAAETIRDLLRVFDSGIVEYPSSFNDIRVTGVILLFVMFLITGIGMLFENAAQIVLLFILLVALMDYLVGACIPPTLEQTAKGFVGWDAQVAKTNFGPDFRDETFFSVFSVFFPSVIGITAGANISGDLKDACFAIPKGTMWAIISTSGSYVVIIIWLGFTILRDATGSVDDVLNGTFRNCSSLHPCPEGLLNNNQVMEMSAGFGPLIYAGIFAASLSSALAALISAPRIFQALCKDRVFPALEFFGKGYGDQNDPRRASIVAVLIALIFTLIGELNAIAPVISNFFMATYGLVNFACFHAALVKSPGFRPGFKYFNKWLSLVGALLCGVVMFIMNWITALITWCIALAIYLYIQKNKTAINWGSSTQGFSYKNALSAVCKLNKVEEHVKNYRPAILVLTGNVSSRPPLVDFTHNITRKLGLMVCGHVIKGSLTQSVRAAMMEHNYQWLRTRKISAFYSLVESESFHQGVHYLLQLVGLGKLKPNILFMGYKSQWQECDPEELMEYFNVVHLAFDMHLSLCILRMEEGLDYAKFFETDLGIPYADAPNCVSPEDKLFQKTDGTATTPSSPKSVVSLDLDSPSMIDQDKSEIDRKHSPPIVSRHFRRLNSLDSAKAHPREVPPEVMNAVNQFQYKQKEGTVDVWWIVDDGGLTMLIPYILSTRSQWASSKLRVFSVAHNENDLDTAQVNMTALLKKFRIDYTSVNVLPDMHSTPSATSLKQFEELISKWLVKDGPRQGNLSVTKTDVTSHRKKTNRLLCLREMIQQNSSKATAIVLTLPMPRKETCPAPLFMAWLEILTRDLPPVLLVRGNQTSVLTFYS